MATPTVTPANHIHWEPNALKGRNVFLLERCSTMQEIKQIHAQIIKEGLVSDTIPATKLLCSCITLPHRRGLAYARRVFERICRPSTFMWNAIIRGYAKSDDPEEAILLYIQMLHNSAPHDAYTFPFLLQGCAELLAIEETQQIHSHIIKRGFDSDVYSANALLHVYAMSGNFALSLQLFDRIPSRDIVSWNSMIDGCVKIGEIEKAWEFFSRMPEKNLISWTSMIAGCVECGLLKEALSLFHEMQAVGIKSDNVALSNALSACAQLGALDQGRWIRAYIEKNRIRIDPVLGCILVDMYAKCGDVEAALNVFKELEERDTATWTAMITGFAIHGRGREALDMFTEMEKAAIEPNQVTFTGVLTACSYAGMVEEGRRLFEKMEKVYNVIPSVEHYGCMVDLLGRAGLLTEAEQLIETMPMKPNSVVWGALLRSCHIHGNFELGKKAGQILIKLDPDHGGRYVHLASVFAAAGQWDKAVKMRKMMKNRGVSKLPGCSSIDLNGVIHDFFAGDRSHPQAEEIYGMWDRIVERFKQEGYVPATGNLLLDLEEEEKENAIHCHSEKLAIAYGLLSTKQGTTIRIIKNLRVCLDCHSATKLISKVYAREIVVRDRTRFHHFRDGKCSCRDYW